MAIIRVIQLKNGKTRVEHTRYGAKADKARGTKEFVSEQPLSDEVKAALDEYLPDESVIVYYQREGEQADIREVFNADEKKT